MGFISGSLYLMGGIMRGATRASMTTGNAIYSALQNARTKKDIKRIAQQAEESNLVSRAVIAMPYVNQGQLMLTSGDDNDVYRYDTKSATPALDYIWGESDDPESVIISGGQPLERVRALMPFVRKVQMAGVPIVVIHNGDDDVESMIDGNSVIQEKIGYDHADYDAFRGMPIEDIANLLYETMEDATGASAEALLRSVLEVVVRKSGVLSFRSLALYQIDDLMDDLDSMKNSGAISPDEYKSISRDYMSGSSEMDSVKAFLHKLNRQMDNIFGKKHTHSSNIKKTLNQKGVISFNIGKRVLLFLYIRCILDELRTDTRLRKRTSQQGGVHFRFITQLLCGLADDIDEMDWLSPDEARLFRCAGRTACLLGRGNS